MLSEVLEHVFQHFEVNPNLAKFWGEKVGEKNYFNSKHRDLQGNMNFDTFFSKNSKILSFLY